MKVISIVTIITITFAIVTEAGNYDGDGHKDGHKDHDEDHKNHTEG